MSRINVLVATTSPDVKAEVIAESISGRPDMALVENRCVAAEDLDRLLARLPKNSPAAIVLVGPRETNWLADSWLAERPDLVVMVVDVIDDIVRIAVRDPQLDSLLVALRGLVERGGAAGQERVARIQLRLVSSPPPSRDTQGLDADRSQGRLLSAAVDWLNEVLRDAVDRVPDGNGELHGFSLTRETLLTLLASPAERNVEEQSLERSRVEAALDRALASVDPKSEPLAALAHLTGLGFGGLEFRMLLLGLAPEIDPRFQRCMGFLLDDMSRRVGTFGLFSALLGSSVRVREQLAQQGALTRWSIFEDAGGRPVAADEPLRVDPFLVQWLLGQRDALLQDPRVRRALRFEPWGGVELLHRYEERVAAASLIGKLQDPGASQWLLLCGDGPAAWRALLELGASGARVDPIRLEPMRLSGSDFNELVESARRIARLARLSARPLIIDVHGAAGTGADEDWLQLLFTELSAAGCRGAILCSDGSSLVRLLGSATFELESQVALPLDARVAAIRAAANCANAQLAEETAQTLLHRYPLPIDRLEQAARLACSRPQDATEPDPTLARFAGACEEIAAEGVSRLADRVQSTFDLEDVVLPEERQRELTEIVDNVRFAAQVLDGWRFGAQLPYGRGVSALFYGPSGTGKTMAALGITRRLGIRMLRIDLSKVVSKYIGDTEKHIDRVFDDARCSGAAIVIDEAEALLGKRSEVKDAHDRYANIEVAYLLQRMEAYEGLAILTTNMRQNIDPAFLRRLRFIVEFPRPDAQARERIWRQCMPEGCHALEDAEFRLLARKIDLTGGHIRQMTLRAAFIAAAANKQIELEHVAQAARAELAKLGMPPTVLDLGRDKRAA